MRDDYKCWIEDHNEKSMIRSWACFSRAYLRGMLAVPVAKADAQGVGSAATYAKRYALAAMVGVAPGEDDDAESIA